MKRIKRTLAIALTLIMAATILVIGAVSASAAGNTGTFGKSLTWTFDSENKMLIVDGSGKMDDFSLYNGNAPWAGFKANIKTVSIGDEVTTIGDYAFSDCKALEDVYFGEAVTSIGVGAFEDCTSIENIYFPDSLTDIGVSAFFGCTSLKSVDVPDGLKSIDQQSFRDCAALEYFRIPQGVVKVGEGTFCNCASLTSISIPDGIKNIYHATFAGCKALETVTLTDSVKSVARDAFWDCPSLTTVNFYGTEEAWNRIAFIAKNDDIINAETKNWLELQRTCDHPVALGEDPCEHIWGEEATVVTPATCGARGSAVYSCTCEDCTAQKTVFTSVSHEWGAPVALRAETCTDNGVYKCTCTGCGEEKVLNVPATNYRDNNGDDQCDSCGKTAEEHGVKPINCFCHCHSGGFRGFIFKITNFFNKLFKLNKTCACGVAHY